LLVQFCEHLLRHKSKAMRLLGDKPLFPQSTGPFFRKRKVRGLTCRKLSNKSWIVTNYNSTTMVNICRELCKKCGINVSKVAIHYQKNSNKSVTTSMPTAVVQRTLFANTEKRGNRIIEDYIRSRRLSPCSIKDIEADTNQPPGMRAAIERFIEKTSRIVEIASGLYIHRASIVDMDEAADQLLEILQTHFVRLNDYSNNHLLLKAAQNDLSMFLNDNNFDNLGTVYNLAKHLFSKENYQGNHFYFYGNTHIWEKEPDYPKGRKGLLIHRARVAGGLITREECESFLETTQLAYSSVNRVLEISTEPTVLQYDTDCYLLSEVLCIDADWQAAVNRALTDLFEDRVFIILRDIKERWFEKLPPLPLGLSWTPRLLQDVLSHFKSIKYRTILALSGQSFDKLHAVIVPEGSQIQTFADVVYEHLKATIELPHRRMDAEHLRLKLCEAGMIIGNELVYNMHKALDDYRFAWSDENRIVNINRV
jgi:hypothetical protein